jgi:type III pantothenate kinase
MILTVDIGNSRIKWALWQAGIIISRGVSEYRSVNAGGNTAEKIKQVLDELFSTVETPQCVFAVCVASQKVCPVLSEWVKQHWQLDVEYLKTRKRFAGITNAYDQPAQHGADRWAGVVAAHRGFPDSSVCVIGAGTAITFDLVDKSGQHLGGYILPSYASMHAALISDTANIESEISMQYRDHEIPDNTSDAVNQGVHKMIKAGVREICRFAQDKMDGPVQVVITGGYARTILAYPDMPAMKHRPDLVMQGLYDIMMRREH